MKGPGRMHRCAWMHQHALVFRQIERSCFQLLAAASGEARLVFNKERAVASQLYGIAEQLSGIQLQSEFFVQQQQGKCAIGAAATKSRAYRNGFVQMDGYRRQWKI